MKKFNYELNASKWENGNWFYEDNVVETETWYENEPNTINVNDKEDLLRMVETIKSDLSDHISKTSYDINNFEEGLYFGPDLKYKVVIKEITEIEETEETEEKIVFETFFWESKLYLDKFC